MTNDETKKFDHVFSGWSVWLEPCPEEADAVINEMNVLMEQCGGAKCGVHPFVPHCTLLYNMPPHLHHASTHNNTDSGDDDSSQHHQGKSLPDDRIRIMGRTLLEQCLMIFKQQRGTQEPQDEEQLLSNQGKHIIEFNGTKSTTDNTNSYRQQQIQESAQCTSQTLNICPTSFYTFSYPKTADDGRGFGCVILMLLLQNTPSLQLLHEITTKIFPPDERHGKAKGKFIPHMALVYAPQHMTLFLMKRNEIMEQMARHLLQPMRARYLSLWSTVGTINEWYCIARIEIP